MIQQKPTSSCFWNGSSWNGTKYCSKRLRSLLEHYAVIIETIPKIQEHSGLTTFLASLCDITSTGQPFWTCTFEKSCPKLHLRNRFQTASLTARCIPGLRIINPRTVCNRMCEQIIRLKRPAVRPILIQRHRTTSLAWCRRHLPVNIQG
jgi:hypothetical protein